MSLESINTTQGNLNINKNVQISTGAKKTQPEESSSKREEKSNGTALLLGSLAALAIGSGIYFITRGKKGHSPTSLSGATTQSASSTENLKDMTIDAFKKAGNTFEKGRATLANGQKFVGKLTQKTKDGSTLIFEYDRFGDHIVTKLKDRKIISKKSYTYIDNKLKYVKDATKSKTDPNAMLVSIGENYIYTKKYTIDKNPKKGLMTINSYNGNDTRYYKYDILDKKYKLEYNVHDGKYTFYHNDGKTKRFTLGDEIILYNNEGKEAKKYAKDSDEAKKFFDIFNQITGKYKP